jgi:hypothetical protein
MVFFTDPPNLPVGTVEDWAWAETSWNLVESPHLREDTDAAAGVKDVVSEGRSGGGEDDVGATVAVVAVVVVVVVVAGCVATTLLLVALFTWTATIGVAGGVCTVVADDDDDAAIVVGSGMVQVQTQGPPLAPLIRVAIVVPPLNCIICGGVVEATGDIVVFTSLEAVGVEVGEAEVVVPGGGEAAAVVVPGGGEAVVPESKLSELL